MGSRRELPEPLIHTPPLFRGDEPMNAKQEILRYTVNIMGGGRNPPDYPYRAVINLRGEGGRRLGTRYFHRSTDTMPKTDHQPQNGIVSCHFPWVQFSAVIDLLRNEKPIWLWYDRNVKMGYISTSPEPVGEGDEA
jgi:hypothetical protein